jgi:hypothetical protein
MNMKRVIVLAVAVAGIGYGALELDSPLTASAGTCCNFSYDCGQGNPMYICKYTGEKCDPVDYGHCQLK